MTFYEGNKKMQTKMHVLWSTEKKKKKKHYHFLSHAIFIHINNNSQNVSSISDALKRRQ